MSLSSSRSCSATARRRRPGSCCRCITRARRSSPTAPARGPSTTSRACMRTASGRRLGRTSAVFRQAIRRTRDGDFELRLSSEERELLRRLPVQLSSLLEEAPADPSLRRLFPPAYDGDADAEAEYRHLMHGELLGKHREALVVLQETTDRDRLRSDEAHAWLTALNDLRLVLGTRLGVTE